MGHPLLELGQDLNDDFYSIMDCNCETQHAERQGGKYVFLEIHCSAQNRVILNTSIKFTYIYVEKLLGIIEMIKQ